MAQDAEKELQQLKKRFHELADKSFQQGIFLFTGFLGLSEQDAFWREESALRYAGVAASGGIEEAERVMVRFGNAEEFGYEMPFPIVCIHISPIMSRFADDLTHRDFLGALMNLGIERSTLGDIKVGDKEAYLFCVDSMKEFICENLTQVKHTHVRCTVTDNPEQLPKEKPERICIQVQSLRADAVLARAYGLSREKSLELFRNGKVFVNGRLCENNSRLIKRGEVLNARGFGRLRVEGEARETRKGRLAVELALYR